jgi:hypothetical protein
MGLLTTVVIIAFVAILVIGGVFFLFHKTVTAPKVTMQGAEGLVINDIKAQNPTANVTLLPGVTNASGSFIIPLSVVYNGTSPCPTLITETFNYPALGLQPIQDTQASASVAGNCQVYIQGSLPPYGPIFIASSYADNNATIRSYVDTFGYNNTSVTARFITSTNSTISGNETNVWAVTYQASTANYMISAILGQSGKILQTYRTSG